MKGTMKENFKKNLNVPNALTALRMLMIPLYLALFIKEMKYTALIVFLLASLTDLLDGMIARRYHLITDLGKLMDPLADKLMILTVMFSMVIGSQAISPVVPWVAVGILLGKELLMMIGGLLMLRHNIVVYSHMIGKIAHCLFIAGLTATFFHDWFSQTFVGWPMTPDLMLIWIAVACTLCAMVFYVADALRKLKAPAANA
ncbi:MAG: CDP-alcohol phosphatidyltransferase family protein [Eubacteriales bacterium]|nr:CDP-alcohol phosphatidyltransferase family protein [Eubacteriales bacterium]